jgi:hypothetical protein
VDITLDLSSRRILKPSDGKLRFRWGEILPLTVAFLNNGIPHDPGTPQLVLCVKEYDATPESSAFILTTAFAKSGSGDNARWISEVSTGTADLKELLGTKSEVHLVADLTVSWGDYRAKSVRLPVTLQAAVYQQDEVPPAAEPPLWDVADLSEEIASRQSGDAALGLRIDATEADITAAEQALALKAPLASPALTGTPTAPTASSGDDSTKIATTAFVKAVIASLISGSPAALDTLAEIAAALGNDANFAATVTTLIGQKLAKSSNLSDLADASIARTNLGLGTAAQQASTAFAAASHGHAQADVSGLVAALAALAPLASPALTGVPTTPTASAGTNTTQIASTAFVQAAVSALVNSSPAALDTLKELADALGNDANFASTITTALANKVDKVAGKGLSTEDYTSAEKTKLGGVATGATANSTDAQLRDRALHTGSQAISTVTGLQSALDERAALANQPNAPVYSGTQSRGAYATIGIGQTTVPVFEVLEVDIPAANPSVLYGMTALSSVGAHNSANAFSVSITSTGSLRFLLNGATTNDYRYADVSGFRAAYSGQRVRLIIERTTTGISATCNGTALTIGADQTAGTAPASWLVAFDLTTFDSGSIGTASGGYPYPGYLRAALGLGELTASARAQIAAGKGWEAWMTPVALGANAVNASAYSSNFTASAQSWVTNSGMVPTITFNETVGGETGCLKVVSPGSGGFQIAKLATLPGKGEKYWLTGKAYLSSSQTVYIREGANAAVRDTGGYLLANGSWVDFKLLVTKVPGDTPALFTLVGSASSQSVLTLANGDFLALKNLEYKTLGLLAEIDGSANVAPGATTWNNPHGAPFVMPASGWTSAKPFSNAEAFTSGYSVTGALNSRMAMQGVEFNGGVIAGTNLAKGTGDFEYSILARLTGYGDVFLTPWATNSFGLRVSTAGKLVADKVNVSSATASALTVPLNRWVLLSYRRVSGVGYYEIDGQPAGSTTDTADYSANGTASAGYNAVSGSRIAHPVDLNTTLTTAERNNFVATGTLPARCYVPGGAQSGITPGTFTALRGTPTLTNNAAASITMAGTGDGRVYSAFVFPDGMKIGSTVTIKGTVTNRASSPNFILRNDGTNTVSADSQASQTVSASGAFSCTLTLTKVSSGMRLQIDNSAYAGSYDFDVASLSVSTNGVTTELDPRWDGRGSIWPDISGAGRHGVLPASGVTPIVAPLVPSPVQGDNYGFVSMLRFQLTAGTAYTTNQVIASIDDTTSGAQLDGLWELTGPAYKGLWHGGHTRGWGVVAGITAINERKAIAEANIGLTTADSGSGVKINVVAVGNFTPTVTNTYNLIAIAGGFSSRNIK